MDKYKKFKLDLIEASKPLFTKHKLLEKVWVAYWGRYGKYELTGHTAGPYCINERDTLQYQNIHLNIINEDEVTDEIWNDIVASGLLDPIIKVMNNFDIDRFVKDNGGFYHDPCYYTLMGIENEIPIDVLMEYCENDEITDFELSLHFVTDEEYGDWE